MESKNPRHSEGMTLGALHDIIGGTLHGDDATPIETVADIMNAQQGAITFVSNSRYHKYLKSTHAAAVVVGEESPPVSIPHIRVSNPQVAMAQILNVFHPSPSWPAGVHPSAVIDDLATVGDGVHIGPHVSVGHECAVGDRAVLLAGVVLQSGVIVGEDSVLHPNVVVQSSCRLGRRVVLGAGTVIGSDGFGYVPLNGDITKMPQSGIVVLEDEVELGANCTVDRATIGETRLARGVKLDNLVHVAHNVKIGEESLFAAQVGISGSTTVGSGVLIGGQAGLAGHITIGDGASVGGQAGVTKSVAAGIAVSGYPARPHMEAKRAEAHIRRLPLLLARLKTVEAALRKLKRGDKSA